MDTGLMIEICTHLLTIVSVSGRTMHSKAYVNNSAFLRPLNFVFNMSIHMGVLLLILYSEVKNKLTQENSRVSLLTKYSI